MPRYNPKARPDVNAFTTIEHCNTVLYRAIDTGDAHYVKLILARRKLLRGKEYPIDDIDLVDDALTGLDLYEHLRTGENGATYTAIRTRTSLKAIGVTEFMKKRVRDKVKMPGFLYLYILGVKEYNCEYLILKHKNCFDDESVQMAQDFVDIVDA
jgi:hypothetical protein